MRTLAPQDPTLVVRARGGDGEDGHDEKGGADMIAHYLGEDTLTTVAGLATIAADHGLTMAQLAIAWVLANDNVASALVGASRPEQVESNVAAAGVRLDAEALARIDAVLGDLPETDQAKTKSPDTRVV